MKELRGWISVQQNIAATGCTLISGTYNAGKQSKFLISCPNGHQRQITAGALRGKKQCPRCWIEKGTGNHLVLKNGLQQAQNIASNRGGKCLSSEYVKDKVKLEWQCTNGHEWPTNLSEIKKGSWCPYCKVYKREGICRELLQLITGVKFPKLRPSWLLNDAGNALELDGYSEQLKLAFEHQGQQHYRAVPHFKNSGTLEKRVYNDEIKLRVCTANSVDVIVIPYSIKIEALPKYLIEKTKLLRPDLKIREDVSISDISLAPSRELEVFKTMAKERGGECTSKVYTGTVGKLDFRCSKGHTWSAVAQSIKNGSWCQRCVQLDFGKTKRCHTVESINKHLSGKGRLVDTVFTGVRTRYMWECTNGHRWSATAQTVMNNGRWCRECHSQRVRTSIEKLREHAAINGGQCLSQKYVSAHTKYKWQCSAGHTWDANWNNVHHGGTWCPSCK